MKPLIVGEAPGKNGDPSKPVEGRIGARLAQCCGIPFEDFLQAFERVNLLDEQPQDSGKGTDFNVKKAARIAKGIMLHPDWLGRTVIILGKRAGAAFGLTKVDYFQRMTIDGATVYIVPHPSGVNRWWNELENECQMIRFMRERVRELK